MATKSAHRHKQTLELGLRPGVIKPPTPQRTARDSPVPTSRCRNTHSHLFTYILSHTLSPFSSLLHTHESSEAERAEDPKGRAACMLWVSQCIMKGLQHLVGAPFIATVRSNKKCFTLIEWVCACVHYVPRNWREADEGDFEEDWERKPREKEGINGRIEESTKEKGEQTCHWKK